MIIDGFDLVAAFEVIESQLNRLGLHLLDELKGYPVWIDNGEGELIEDRDRLIYVIKQLTAIPGISPQETFAGIGAVGGTLTTLELVEAVNTAKDAFKALVKQYGKDHQLLDTAPIRQLLAFHGYPGIRLKQVYRHFRSLSFHPRRISFSCVKHNIKKVITTTEAAQLLRKTGQGINLDIQLAKLSLLKPHSSLVIHRDIQPCWLANIASFKAPNKRSTFSMLHTQLPVFYLHQPDQPLPKVVIGKKQQRDVKTARADKQLEKVPFLPAIHAYRYKAVKY